MTHSFIHPKLSISMTCYGVNTFQINKILSEYRGWLHEFNSATTMDTACATPLNGADRCPTKLHFPQQSFRFHEMTVRRQPAFLGCDWLLLLNSAALFPSSRMRPGWRHYSISLGLLPRNNEMQRDAYTMEEFNSISCLFSSKRVRLIQSEMWPILTKLIAVSFDLVFTLLKGSDQRRNELQFDKVVDWYGNRARKSDSSSWSWMSRDNNRHLKNVPKES